MTLAQILQYLSHFSSIFPFIGVMLYWQKKGFRFDTKINFISVYYIIYFLFQILMLILSLNGIHNLFLIRIFTPIEVFIFGFFTLSIQMQSQKVSLFLAIVLTVIILIIDFIWGKSNSLPVESLMVESITITLIGMSAIPSIRIKKDYEISFYYFTFAIIFASVNIFLGVGFIDLAPELSFSIQAIVTIISNLIFAWGFYIIFKNDKSTKNNRVQ